MLEKTVSLVDTKNAAGEGSAENEERVTGNWRKGDPCYIVVGSLGKLFPAVI